MMLEIRNLYVSTDGKSLLKGVTLTINAGEIHAVMGPNGAGKSTLAKVLAGHPAYEVTGGEVIYKGKNLLEMPPEERAHAGIFLGFQYPIEIPGVSNLQFLSTSFNSIRKARGEAAMPPEEFEKYLEEKMALVQVKPEFKDRNLNEGFSGGEKKRNELLQMAVLNPTMAILDETDSGLDIDALRVVAEGVNGLMNDQMGLLLITHYQRLLNYITPHFVHVMKEGRILRTGGPELAHELERKGYDWVKGEGVQG